MSVGRFDVLTGRLFPRPRLCDNFLLATMHALSTQVQNSARPLKILFLARLLDYTPMPCALESYFDMVYSFWDASGLFFFARRKHLGQLWWQNIQYYRDKWASLS